MRPLSVVRAQPLRLLSITRCDNVRQQTWQCTRPWMLRGDNVNSPQRCRTRQLTTSTTIRTEDQQDFLTSIATHTAVRSADIRDASTPASFLPVSCPGCGALTQEIASDQAGFYSKSRRVIKIFLQGERKKHRLAKEESVEESAEESAEVSSSFEPLSSAVQDKLVDRASTEEAIASKDSTVAKQEASNIPFCDRCHQLLHLNLGQSIAHPSLDSIADSIAESPFKRNHVYHVVDAADFPMSLLPSIFHKIELAKPRSQNRRSQHDFSTKPSISFIITRSDLLGSTKEMVDSMMVYFQNTLRRAMGRSGKNMRLGNVHLVSAKRGWWTKELKEDIWKRGGGNWLMGRVNVGKSNLFEVIFPKGSGDRAPVYSELQKETQNRDYDEVPIEALMQETSLLPPPQPESPFPVMPVVSSLPGTTASPIRLPFGKHRGELIDLPGLQRGDLEKYIKPDHRLELIMSHRENVQQLSIRPGQCIEFANGLVTIVPEFAENDQSMTFLVYSFVPLTAHVTKASKAQMHIHPEERNSKSILEADTINKLTSAGKFSLDTDVTKSNAGPLLRAGVSLESLPFRVYATDILIEGVGWVELVCQVRRRRDGAARQESGIVKEDQDDLTTADQGTEMPVREAQKVTVTEGQQIEAEFSPFGVEAEPSIQEVSTPDSASEKITRSSPYPVIEVFSPNGKHIGQRQCLQAWSRWNLGQRQKDAAKLGRPRRAIKSRSSSSRTRA